MEKIKTESGHEIEVYSTIDEMPIVRYHKYNQYMVLGIGTGTDAGEMPRKIQAIARLIDAGRGQEAKVELSNLNLSLSMVRSGVDVQSLALAATVRRIDGKEREDITENGLRETAAILDEILTKGERDGTAGLVKKKIGNELRYFYPDGEGESEQMALLRTLCLTVLDEIIDGKDRSTEKSRIERRIDEIMEVCDFTRYERDDDVSFEQGCLGIQETLHADAKKMTVKEYYAAIKMLQDRAKEIESIRNKHK